MEQVRTLFSDKLRLFETHKIELGLLAGSVSCCLVALGTLAYSIRAQDKMPALDCPKAINESATSAAKIGSESAGGIVADIAGAVNRPGVYTLPSPARINDLLQKADGLSEQADFTYVARTVNLAQTLQDQQKVYIPSLGEEPVEAGSQGPMSAIPANPGVGPSQGPLLSINSASQSELEELPGIGQITAEKIINGRPYSSIEELSNNGILTKKVFEAVKEKISL